MDLRELIVALLDFDILTARQWVADAYRLPIQWSHVAQPAGMTTEQLSVAAAVVELLASRMGQQPPEWTGTIPSSPHPIFLVRAAESMPRLRRMCELESPEPLRRRRIYAPPEFLTFA